MKHRGRGREIPCTFHDLKMEGAIGKGPEKEQLLGTETTSKETAT